MLSWSLVTHSINQVKKECVQMHVCKNVKWAAASLVLPSALFCNPLVWQGIVILDGIKKKGCCSVYIPQSLIYFVLVLKLTFDIHLQCDLFNTGLGSEENHLCIYISFV
jgi:hypothetical protein